MCNILSILHRGQESILDETYYFKAAVMQYLRDCRITANGTLYDIQNYIIIVD